MTAHRPKPREESCQPECAVTGFAAGFTTPSKRRAKIVQLLSYPIEPCEGVTRQLVSMSFVSEGEEVIEVERPGARIVRVLRKPLVGIFTYGLQQSIPYRSAFRIHCDQAFF